jgi:hypothetical protein
MNVDFTERYTNVYPRDNWPAGPWDDEPEDKVVWVDPATRHPPTSHWPTSLVRSPTSQPN